MSEPESADSTVMAEALADISQSIFPKDTDEAGDEPVVPEGEQEELTLDEPAEEAVAAPAEESSPEPVQTRAPPKSWAKETHDLWAKTDPKVQEYIEKREKDFLDGLDQYKTDAQVAREFKDILTPYRPMLAAQGVNESQAIQYLMNAQYRLTNGTPEERAAAFRQMGQDLGLMTQENEPEVAPEIAHLRKELNGVKSVLSQRDTAEQQARRAVADAEVSKFASDPANLYLSEVSPDMVAFVNAGMSLKDAYDRAVWANPTTRTKELARLQTEAEAKLKEKARGEGEAAKKATATNIRGSESRKAPTEPKGTMDDTLRATLKQIKERPH